MKSSSISPYRRYRPRFPRLGPRLGLDLGSAGHSEATIFQLPQIGFHRRLAQQRLDQELHSHLVYEEFFVNVYVCIHKYE